MARRTDSAADVEGGSWRPDAAQLGWIIENRLDEAYVLSWPGQLETYVPLHDTGGYDRARAPLGSYDFRLDQVKGTASLHPGNLLEMSFATPALHPRRHLDFTFLDFAALSPGGTTCYGCAQPLGGSGVASASIL